MLYPKPLIKGDRIAIVSLSNGIPGEAYCAHEKELGEKTLRAFGIEPVYMTHACDGAEAIWKHPEKTERPI